MSCRSDSPDRQLAVLDLLGQRGCDELVGVRRVGPCPRRRVRSCRPLGHPRRQADRCPLIRL
ncbi:hypothetical protein ACFPM0_22100 [Pseudonocardia sulfidoxydans]|uniref:hypothetical protein n=1 Tax=Pseudonocardia sulfidoxydans TaxID=54011 RepID=UPI0036169875